jgi:hypothetical protein
MSDIERVTRAKKEADEAAYKRGMKEGWTDAVWLFVLISAVVLVVAG